MEKKSKVLIAFLFILIAVSVWVTYHRYIVLRDYPVIEAPAENN